MLELKLNYRNKIYIKKIEEEREDPLYAAAVADAVLERLERVESENPAIVDTQEIAIISGLVAEYEYSNQKDLYIRTITEAHKKISDARLLLNSAMDSLRKEGDDNEEDTLQTISKQDETSAISKHRQPLTSS